MIDVQIDTAVFNAVYRPHLANMARTQIFFGGSSSGKSVFLAQRTIYDILAGGRNYLICREVARTLRHSVFAEVVKVISRWRLLHLFTINKSDLVITCQNGYQILFGGLDDTEKLKSLTPAKGVITDVWVEEATETDADSIKQLYKRQRGGDERTPKRLTLSFNPILQSHHIYTTYFAPLAWADDQTAHNDGNLSVLKTWYIHNQFLTAADRADLENERDEYYRNVYTFGNWGTLGDVIFTNWEVADLSGMTDHFTNRRAGLDFGFSSDPAALSVSHYDQAKKTIYVFRELYERGLTNDMLATAVKDIDPGCYIVCDSAEPKSIQELANEGLAVIGARKGKDSVNYGIQWLQQQRIIIDRSCIHTRNEFQQYQWKKDKDGNTMRVPIDKINHIIDTLRYAYEDETNKITTIPNPFYN